MEDAFPELDASAALEAARRSRAALGGGAAWLMFSTWLGGWVRDPVWMTVPLDDHVVHRGDGVFEAMKAVDGRLYNLAGHLDRLEASSRFLGIEWPMGRAELERLVLSGLRRVGQAQALVRLYLTRGPGGFTTNPRECPRAHLYLAYCPLKAPSQAARQAGVRVGLSSVPQKSPVFAAVKSCNYLQNVLMKMEANTRGLDYVVGVDEAGYITESSTENVALVTPEGSWQTPSLDHVLRGTTLLRVMAHARKAVEAGRLQEAVTRPLRPEDFLKASEIWMIGTTIDVLPVCAWEGQVVGDGRQGPWGAWFQERLEAEMREDGPWTHGFMHG